MRISDWSSDVCSSDLIPVDMLMPKLVAAELHHGNQRNFNAFASRRDAGKHPRNLDVVGERQQGLIHDLGSADGPGNGNARHVGRIAMHEIVRVEMMKVAVAIPAGDRKSTRLNSSH